LPFPLDSGRQVSCPNLPYAPPEDGGVGSRRSLRQKASDGAHYDKRNIAPRRERVNSRMRLLRVEAGSTLPNPPSVRAAQRLDQRITTAAIVGFMLHFHTLAKATLTGVWGH
jgi:hypothetical protein